MFASRAFKRETYTKWSKLILPQRFLRFYPPVFTIRNPIESGVKRAFKEDYQVAVIAFNLAKLNELTDLLGKKQINTCKQTIRKIFKDVFQKSVDDNDIIALYNYYSEGLALLVKIDSEKTSVSEIELLIKKMKCSVKTILVEQYPQLAIDFHTGYMFVEKNGESVAEALLKAQQQAIAMADKRVTTEYNEMLIEMGKIIEKRDIRLLAQPIIDVSSNDITAWEMLSRGPVGTSLENPLPLFSVARQTGMLFDLELIVLEKAFKQIVDIGCQQRVFINFTPMTLGNPRFIKALNRLLLKYSEINPNEIIFEITERDSIDEVTCFIANIKKLRSYGFKIAIDDTGAGYASLHTISKIMPDIIKIDRSVIQDIDTNKVKESMLKGLLLIAKETGSLVVAEGIENEGEAAVLSRNKVDLAQGYFYAKPGDMLLINKISS